MRPDREGWWYSPEDGIVELAHVSSDGEEIEIWRDGEILIPEEVGEGWLPVPTREQHEAMVRELRQLREELEALRKGKEGGQ